MTILVTGAGGFIGGHFIKYLIEEKGVNPHDIYAVDIKKKDDWFQTFPVVNIDCRNLLNNRFGISPFAHADHIYNFACDRGGIEYIVNNQLASVTSSLINTYLLQEARLHNVKRYFFASSVCIYPNYRFNDKNCPPLNECEDIPADSNETYGWEKLWAERCCQVYNRFCGLETRIARFNTVYGGYESFNDNKEKAPVAILRKTVMAKLTDQKNIEIWGDGNQKRIFFHVNDCVKAIDLVTDCDDPTPFNIGTDEVVTINELVDMAEEIVQVKLNRVYLQNKPSGVYNRQINCSKFSNKFNWSPQIKLKDGLTMMYPWVYKKCLDLLKK